MNPFIPQLARRAAILGAATALALSALPAVADTYPSKPIRILIGIGAGGTADSTARLYGQKLSEVLNTPVIVDNRPGANQVTAIRGLMAAAPDGYTLYAATAGSLVQNPAMRSGLPYDPQKDFTLLGIMTTIQGVIFVNNDLPVKNLKELIDYARAHPGKLNYGSAGVGTTGHLAVEALMSATGIKMTHVPYKGDADVFRGVMTNDLQLAMLPTVNSVQMVKAGKVRGIAVTSMNRIPDLPDVPGLSETPSVKNLGTLDPHTFIALVGPAGLSPAVVTKLSDAINKISAMPDVDARVRNDLHSTPVVGTPQSFKAFMEKQLALWREIGKTVKLPDF